MALLVLGSVDSTMDVAREMLQLGQVVIDEAGSVEPAGVLALDQTLGRGQRGRSWYSRAGESLCATYYIPWKQIDLKLAPRIGIASGIAVLRTLRAACLEQSVRTETLFDIGIKWPNDIILNGKKLGGVLVELVQSKVGIPVALVGVGVNLTNMHFPAELAEISTSLLLEGFTPRTAQILGAQIYEEIVSCVQLCIGPEFCSIIDEFNAFDRTLGRVYYIDTAAGRVAGEAAGVSRDGELIIRMDDGSERTITSVSTIQASAL